MGSKNKKKIKMERRNKEKQEQAQILQFYKKEGHYPEDNEGKAQEIDTELVRYQNGLKIGYIMPDQTFEYYSGENAWRLDKAEELYKEVDHGSLQFLRPMLQWWANVERIRNQR